MITIPSNKRNTLGNGWQLLQCSGMWQQFWLKSPMSSNDSRAEHFYQTCDAWHQSKPQMLHGTKWKSLHYGKERGETLKWVNESERKVCDKAMITYSLMHGNVTRRPPLANTPGNSAVIHCKFDRTNPNFASLKYPFRSCSISELKSAPCISRPSNEYHLRDKKVLQSGTSPQK